MFKKLWHLIKNSVKNLDVSSKPLPTHTIKGMTADAVAEKLLRTSYFPRQRTNFDEFPPVFDSTTFTLSIAKKFKGLGENNPKYGHDAVTATLTRADGHQRHFSIPHPAAYANLVLILREYWPVINIRSNSPNSYIKPRPHLDGRLIVMSYQNWIVKSLGGLKHRISNHFIVHADIANFFPSIYTHSIAWALVGIKTAKSSDKKQWFDKIDQAFQSVKRKETNGIAVGPATSNIAAEIILKKVDEALTKKGFEFYRYIDDYTCFTKSKTLAEEFINELRMELNRYKLTLNSKKTIIKSLPEHNSDPWLYKIKQVSKQLPIKPSPGQITDFTESIIDIGEKYSDNNVYKYGFAILGKKKLSEYARQSAFLACLSLCFQIPNLASTLRYFSVSKFYFKANGLDRGLTELLEEAAIKRQSDSICWYLFYCDYYDIVVPSSISSKIIDSRDCLSLLLLYVYGTKSAKSEVINFAKKAVKANDPHDRHQYWLLIYELFRRKAIKNVGLDNQQFTMLVNENVHFCNA